MAAAKESKHDRFIRIAEARTNKAGEMIRLIGNCANTGSYEYTEEDVKKIFAYLERELKSARSRFSGAEAEDGKFSLR